MGVSGVGKTTIGELVAKELGWRLVEGDDFHPRENVAKMAAGTPLEDGDRWPWLDALNKALRKETDAVVTCSALKESYRKRLLDGIDDFLLVYLYGSRELLASRLAKRKHRYMPASLLDSQLATLEPPSHALCVDVAADAKHSAAVIVKAVRG